MLVAGGGCIPPYYSRKQLSLREVKAETQGRNLGSGADAEALGECHLLAWSSWLVQSVFLHYPEPSTHG